MAAQSKVCMGILVALSAQVGSGWGGVVFQISEDSKGSYPGASLVDLPTCFPCVTGNMIAGEQEGFFF